MAEAFGSLEYPGIASVVDFEFTDLAGISPAIARITIHPQDEVPQLEGDLILKYQDAFETDYYITIPNMHIDAANFTRNSGGQIVMLRMFDERWQWQFGHISGRYNTRFVKCYDAAFPEGFANQFVDPQHEKNPQELALLCIDAMGYSEDDWDVSALPLEARPEINWDRANPAQELNKLCNDFGCRIVPIRSEEAWQICVTGEGAELPDDWPYQDPGDGVDPAEKPGYLRIYTAPILYETRLPLEHVGQDMDFWYTTLPKLSYNPTPGPQIGQGASGFESCGPEFVGYLSGIRQELPDQTLVSPAEMAMRSVNRYSKIRGATDEIANPQRPQTIYVPGYGSAFIQQVVLTDNRVQPYIVTGATSAMPLRAYIEGTFWVESTPNGDQNYPLGSRIDLAAKADVFKENYDKTASFVIQNADDARYALISFSTRMVQKKTVTLNNLTFDSYYAPADLYLHTAIKVKDPTTWQVKRDYRDRWVGDGPEPDDPSETTVMAVIKDDIQPWYRGIYDPDGTLTLTTDNSDLVTKQCNYYLDALQKTMETVDTSWRTYQGWFPIDLDGQIQQVTWRMSNGGFDTIASKNSEHRFEIPTYEQRRARDARRSPENKEALAREIERELKQQGAVLP